MLRRLLQRLTSVDADDLGPALTSALYFFCVLGGYYLLRPLREDMGLAGGVRNLPWLYSANLAVMLALAPVFGWITTRLARRVFVPWIYRFFLLTFVGFYLAWRWLPAGADVTLGRAFYIWVSVFNMWAVSLFWSVMADRWGLDRSKRVFGFIAVGGTVGAALGSWITSSAIAGGADRGLLILAAAAVLEVVARLGRRLVGQAEAAAPQASAASGGVWSGITAVARSRYLLGIAAYIFLFTVTSTFLYFTKAKIVAAAAADSASRTVLFGHIDLWTNLATLALQLGLARWLMARVGVGWTLLVLPVVTVLGFGALAAAPVMPVLVLFEMVRRAGNYALTRPARETLFTVVPVDQKYKAKSFIDTFVYRGGDVVGALAEKALAGLALGIAGVAGAVVPIAAAWGAVGLALGAAQRRRAANPKETACPPIAETS